MKDRENVLVFISI